jgi:hypothetical protein
MFVAAFLALITIDARAGNDRRHHHTSAGRVASRRPTAIATAVATSLRTPWEPAT